MANDAWSYVQFTCLIILINQCAVGLGLFISSFSPNPLVGLALGTTLLLTPTHTPIQTATLPSLTLSCFPVSSTWQCPRW